MTAFLLAHLWAIVTALIGIAGGGAALFAIFGLGMSLPALLGVVIGAVEAIFDFFKTPVGQVLGIIMLCALFCVIGVVHTAKVYEVKIVALNAAHQRDIDGLNSAWQGKVDEAGAKFKQDRKDRDDDVDTEVSAKVAAATADLTAHADKLQAEVNAYAKLPHQKCVLGPADLDDGVRAPGH